MAGNQCSRVGCGCSEFRPRAVLGPTIRPLLVVLALLVLLWSLSGCAAPRRRPKPRAAHQKPYNVAVLSLTNGGQAYLVWPLETVDENEAELLRELVEWRARE